MAEAVAVVTARARIQASPRDEPLIAEKDERTALVGAHEIAPRDVGGLENNAVDCIGMVTRGHELALDLTTGGVHG